MVHDGYVRMNGNMVQRCFTESETVELMITNHLQKQWATSGQNVLMELKYMAGTMWKLA